LAQDLHALKASPEATCASRRWSQTMPRSAQPWQRLNALAVALEAAEMREPYPRLARLMQSLTSRQSGMHAAASRALTYN
jgi:hypothetical protein